MTVCEDAASLFVSHFGEVPDGVWWAPGRINLIGEHVDYAGGLCLPAALPHRTAVAVRLRTDHRIRLFSTGFDVVDVDPRDRRVTGWGAYVAGVIDAVDPPGFTGADLAVASDVPVGAGLSSSAALEAAVALALADLHALPTDDAGRAALAEACVRAENDYVGAPTGGMDQQIALRGRAGHALLLDCADGSVDHIPFPDGPVILVIDTGTGHRLVDGQYGNRRAEVDDAERRVGSPLRTLTAPPELPDPVLRRRARHVVTEIARVRDAVEVLRDGHPTDLGRILDASHASLRDDFEVSCAELDVAAEAARAGGALGARMVGGGFGGSVIALCDPATVPAVRAAVVSAADRHGFPTPTFLSATASDGAQRCTGRAEAR